MACPPELVNYLVVQTSATNTFADVAEEILPASTTSFAVTGAAGTTKYVRAKWRRTTDPLEESGWSEVLELVFTTTGGGGNGGGNGNGEEPCGPQQSGLVLQFDGSQAVAQSLASLRCPFKGTFKSWFIDVNPADSGTNILNVRKNGAAIFDAAWRPAITGSALTTNGNVFQTTTFEKDDLIQMDIDQIGTSGPRRITLQIQIERDCTTP